MWKRYQAIDNNDAKNNNNSTTTTTINNIFTNSSTTTLKEEKSILLKKNNNKKFILNINVKYSNKRPRNTLDEYLPINYNNNINENINKNNKIIIFLHGGTFISGDSSLYFEFGKFCSESCGLPCYIVNYTLYPNGYLEEMIEDITMSIDFIINRVNQFNNKNNNDNMNENNKEIILVGHSAGAYLSITTLINKLFESIISVNNNFKWNIKEISKLVLLSGVYDFVIHYEYEKTRNVHILSPMWKVCKGVDKLKDFSPNRLLLEGKLINKEDNNNENNHEEEVNNSLKDNWPKTIIVHGQSYITCPILQSEIMNEKLKQVIGCSGNGNSDSNNNSSNDSDSMNNDCCEKIKFYALSDFNHSDPIVGFMGIAENLEKRDFIWNLIIKDE
ncbi:hypothetical protein ABK040_009451 [Willaertia magna]